MVEASYSETAATVARLESPDMTLTASPKETKAREMRFRL